MRDVSYLLENLTVSGSVRSSDRIRYGILAMAYAKGRGIARWYLLR